MRAFTPTPWVVAANDETIATVATGPFHGDAQLSAADLLAALIAMEREFGSTYLPGSSPAVDAARAAIAKALGGTP